MAMRPPRSTGGRRPAGGQQGAVRPVYEDFKPVSEWIQDEESAKLLIHLPGFTKESLQVSTEGRHTIRVRGERLVGGNKWQRFQQDYQVPDGCNIRATRARFELGTLTISIPKKITHKDHLVPKPTQDQSSTSAPASASSPTPGPVLPPKHAEPTQDQASPLGRSPTMSPEPLKPSITKPAQAQASASGLSTGPFLPPRPAKPSISKPELSPQEAQREPTKTPHFDDEEKVVRPRTSDDKQKDQTIAEPPATQGMLDEEKPPKKETDKDDMEALANMRESIRGKAKKSTGKGENVEPTANETMNAGSSSTSHFGMEHLKKSVKFLAEKDEDRQLLVNVGAAVLVIVALGTYIYNTIGE